MNAGFGQHRFINAGTLCMVPGLGLMLFGAVRTLGFLRIVHTYQQITARELLVKLIVPHMVLLLGVGLVAAGLVCLTRAAVIRSRTRHEKI